MKQKCEDCKHSYVKWNEGRDKYSNSFGPKEKQAIQRKSNMKTISMHMFTDLGDLNIYIINHKIMNGDIINIETSDIYYKVWYFTPTEKEKK